MSFLSAITRTLRKTVKRGANAVRRVGKGARYTVKPATNMLGLTKKKHRKSHRKSRKSRK